MAEIREQIERQSFRRRVLSPAGAALFAWFILNLATDYLGCFGHGSAYRIAALILYPLLGLVITFSSLAVYGIMYARGASTGERAAWSCVVPLAWILKEIWRVRAFFSWGESLYYGLSPQALGLLVFQLFCLCLCELFWRWRNRKRGMALRIWTPGPMAGLVAALILLYVMALWGNPGDTPGSQWFYLYMEGYKVLFLRP